MCAFTFEHERCVGDIWYSMLVYVYFNCYVFVSANSNHMHCVDLFRSVNVMMFLKTVRVVLIPIQRVRINM